jgi:hypothetical protein
VGGGGHGARVTELEENIAKLLADLKQTHATLAEAETTQSSLSMDRKKLDEECVGLCTAVETLEQEKTRDVAAREIEHKKIQDYHVHHCKKLCELRVNLKGVVNEIGVQCLPYPGKGSSIGEIVEWFEKEIQALPNAITKANKNFLCYCLVGVVRMLYESANCDHLEGRTRGYHEFMRCFPFGGYTRGDSEALGTYCEKVVDLA